MVQIDAAFDLGQGDLAAVFRLLPRQAEGAQGLDVAIQHRLRRHRPAQTFDCARPDGGGGGDRHLLLHDHPEQALVSAGPQTPFEHGGLGMGPRQGGVGLGQSLTRGGDVLGCGRDGHEACMARL